MTVVRESGARLRVTGELDAASATGLAVHLADPDVHELDLSGVSFIDAAGLSVLLAARGTIGRPHLQVLTPSTAVTRILEICDEVGTFAVWP